MKILSCNNFIQGAYSIRSLYIQSCNIELKYQYSVKTPGLISVLTKYTLNDIRKSINNIDVDKDGNLIVPEHSESSKILRLLEFGGENTKPTHLLSITKNRLLNALDMGGIK